MRTLNLGILAHVDAGKTSLTERLLFAAGVIDAIGSVDRGDTQTDTLALERERGITIKTAVASFVLGDVAVNLIDTPGHPDFIAEVDRVLSLLDGAILVVSAVEGVQSQTRLLMRALQRLGVPTLIFVNKIDRMGADADRVLAAVEEKLSPAAVAMERLDRPGTRAAGVAPFGPDDAAFVGDMVAVIAEHDDGVLARYVDGGSGEDHDAIREQLATWTKRAAVHPVFFGSAITGAGIAELVAGISELLPVLDRGSDGPVSGVVFKIERSPSGAPVPLVRMFTGTVTRRDRVLVRGELRRVTNVAVFDEGTVEDRDSVVGGQIARLGGLGPVRIGDAIGDVPGRYEPQFSPPPFEALVRPLDSGDRHPLRSALDLLAQEDPLINVRQDDARGQISVSLYGDVQREVISDTLARDFGIAVDFSDTVIVCVERLNGPGEAVESMPGGRTSLTPFLAGVGLRVEPAPPGTGVTFSPGIELGRLPMAFVNAVNDAVRVTLRQGLYGWDIPDCAVTMIASSYAPRQSHAHATFDKNMSSVASDFRLLTPLVLMDACRNAGTTVHEPVHRFHLEAPFETLGVLTRLLGSVNAVLDAPEQAGSSVVLRGLVPADRLVELRQQLPGLTQGDGFVESTFDSYRATHGAIRTRARTDHDPLDRKRYLRELAGRSSAT
jgi:ribosomal protection tetracycline resistance protein